MTICGTKVFIIDGYDPVTSHSQKYLLETCKHSVEIIDCEGKLEISHMEHQDIVLLDIGLENPRNFSLLDRFLKARSRPKLLLTTIENQIFNRHDKLQGGAAQILFKPFSPRDLISAINLLHGITHA